MHLLARILWPINIGRLLIASILRDLENAIFRCQLNCSGIAVHQFVCILDLNWYISHFCWWFTVLHLHIISTELKWKHFTIFFSLLDCESFLSFEFTACLLARIFDILIWSLTLCLKCKFCCFQWPVFTIDSAKGTWIVFKASFLCIPCSPQ